MNCGICGDKILAGIVVRSQKWHGGITTDKAICRKCYKVWNEAAEELAV